MMLGSRDIETLTVDERLDLIGLLWDSLTSNAVQLPVPDWHKRGLEAREAEFARNPETMSIDEFEAALDAELAR